MDQLAVQKYVTLFEHRIQSGGGQLDDEYPVFRGVRYTQYGSGFGDVLRGIFRFILPVAAQAAHTFLGETMKARETGADWKTAAKAALVPTTTGALTQAVDTLKQTQSGSGKRRKSKKSKQYKKGKRARMDYSNWNF